MNDTADIQAMLNWLATCPLTNALGDGDVAFSIEYLGAEPVQFSLEATPAAPVLEQFFLGSRRARNYVLASRMSYTKRQTVRSGTSLQLGWNASPQPGSCRSWHPESARKRSSAFPRVTL